MADIFYVYEHWRLDKDECFYVGKGHKDRAYRRNGRGDHWHNIVNKLDRIGSGYEVKLVATGLSEKQAFSLEVERISFWRDKVDLANKTNGGDGISGYKMTEEAKAKMREKAKGRPGIKSMLGRKHTDETRAKMSSAQIGIKKSPKHAKAVRDALWGQNHIAMTKEQKRIRDNELRREKRRLHRAGILVSQGNQ